MTPTLDYEYISKHLRVEAETGRLFWIKPKDGRQLHKEAGHCDKTGYRRICLNYKMYLAHRVVFLLIHKRWPLMLDHIDRNPRNNSPSNLRETNHSENAMNSEVRRDNTTGFKGLFFDKRNNKWSARKRGKSLGSFLTKTEAILAYEAAP